MEIILLEEIEKVGEKYEIVKVKNGFGRNFLIPQKKAIIANSSNRRRLAEMRRIEDLRESKMLGTYQEMADKLKGKSLSIDAKAGTTGKIFGSVTNVQLAQAIKETFGLEIDRRKIQLPAEVKELGSYTAVINLHQDVVSEVKFDVVQG